ncbi:metallophosphatase domain-containing protein [Autumnicola musiva]|uniref:Metallophosphatase domain-containing protein n=1 Tax=Autumnicola musiva TaxID=3075589 RepID=A0ABU3D0L7_9FLAO|nr:metallophosphatase domain-containing protein [Zunongwangia sp. F117]MDT0675086.1 metallophosphatase domain-containing protein [Zunongwangia sp. F117]
MEVTCISDTHNKHDELSLPEADLLIHAGDFTEAGTKKESLEFLNWFSSQPHKNKILIAGNHDFYFEKHKDIYNIIPENIHYLKDSGIEINGLYFWGSPVTPGQLGWAFNRERGREIKKHWDKIPVNTNVLITHTPPYKIMDVLDNGEHIGCEELRKKINDLHLKMHVYGHLHDSYGSVKAAECLYVNASCLDQKHRNINIPNTYTL